MMLGCAGPATAAESWVTPSRDANRWFMARAGGVDDRMAVLGEDGHQESNPCAGKSNIRVGLMLRLL